MCRVGSGKLQDVCMREGREISGYVFVWWRECTGDAGACQCAISFGSGLSCGQETNLVSVIKESGSGVL
jgi:hypothetical protein